MKWVVATGLSRRLVEADSAEDAVLTYVYDVPLRRHAAIRPVDVTVRPATDADVAEFAKRRRPKPGDDQLAMPLGDVGRHRSKKTPA